jgi:hypothetical protein
MARKIVSHSSNDATRILKDSGFQVPEFARYVDKYGMIRFVKREIGEKSVKFHGWREVSRTEAEKITRANNELKREYLKPKMKKYY